MNTYTELNLRNAFADNTLHSVETQNWTPLYYRKHNWNLVKPLKLYVQHHWTNKLTSRKSFRFMENNKKKKKKTIAIEIGQEVTNYHETFQIVLVTGTEWLEINWSMIHKVRNSFFILPFVYIAYMIGSRWNRNNVVKFGECIFHLMTKAFSSKVSCLILLCENIEDDQLYKCTIHQTNNFNICATQLTTKKKKHASAHGTRARTVFVLRFIVSVLFFFRFTFCVQMTQKCCLDLLMFFFSCSDVGLAYLAFFQISNFVLDN